MYYISLHRRIVFDKEYTTINDKVSPAYKEETKHENEIYEKWFYN